MKHGKKFDYRNLIIIVLIIISVGLGGYILGNKFTSHSNSNAPTTSKVVHSSKSSSKSVASSEIYSSVNSSSETSEEHVSSSSTSGVYETGNINKYYDTNLQTFMGCKTLTDFVNEYGCTPWAYLEQQGYTKDEIEQFFANINYKFLTSGEMQTLIEDGYNPNN